MAKHYLGFPRIICVETCTCFVMYTYKVGLVIITKFLAIICAPEFDELMVLRYIYRTGYIWNLVYFLIAQ